MMLFWPHAKSQRKENEYFGNLSMNDKLSEIQAGLLQLLELGKLSKEDYSRLMGVDSAIAVNTGNGAVALSGGVAAGDGGIAIGGNVHGDVYLGKPPKDGLQALEIYRAVLVRSLGLLSLRGLDFGSADASRGKKPLDLVGVYVDLDTRSQKEVKGNDKDLQRVPLSALEAVTANRGMVLLGDPGSGKSTFVNHLAHCLARHALESKQAEPKQAWLSRLPGWPESEGGLLPVVVILRDYAGTIKETDQPDPAHLWNFIAARLEAQNLIAAIKPVLAKLEDGKALVLLDGLDEVTTAAQRRFVRDVVSAFMHRYPTNRYLLTCRILSYQAPSEANGEDLRIQTLPTYTLAPLDEPKQDRFVAAWYAELVEKGQVRREEQAGKSYSLQTAVRRHDLQTMARNPLLLTVMAVLHTHKELPDARAILYGDTVDLLLSRWEAQKAGTGGSADGILSLLRQAGRSETDLISVLRKLAYNAQAQTAEGQLADISEHDLLHALAGLKKNSEGLGDLNWAQKVTVSMKLRAGLLIERTPGVFAFPHRTFQEYLAGVHLTSVGDFADLAKKLADDRTRWREALLLAVGHLVYVNGETSRPLFLAGELCPSRLTDDETAWRKAWLAGEVLMEIGLLRVADSDSGQELLDRVRRRLLALITGGKLTAAERVYVGDTLAQLGDPRESVLSVDAMEFCWVPQGPFLFGSGEEDTNAGKGEKPRKDYLLDYSYWIARYPVSVAQFRHYLAESGEQPADPDCLSGTPNHPVVNVTWDESKAFCAWLTQRLQQQGFIPQSWSVDLPNEPEWEKAARGGLKIPQLPLILQIPPNPDTAVIPADFMDRRNPDCRACPGMERRGMLQSPHHPWSLDSGDPCRNDDNVFLPNPSPSRIYPWGDKADVERMNYADTGVNQTSANGCFPGGASPYGAEEMAGNVWEWTRSIYRPYPYESGDGREDSASRKPRVLRGGAFFNGSRLARCSARDSDGPDARYSSIGFRVVVSPFTFSER